MKHLDELTEKEFDTLKKSGLLNTIYPEAPNNYKDIKGTRPLPKPIHEIDIQSFINFGEAILNDYEKIGYSKDEQHYAYDTIMNAVYGQSVWDFINKHS